MKNRNYPIPAIIGVIIIFLLVGCEAPNDDARFEEEIELLTQNVLEVWNEGNLDLVEDVFALDAVRQIVGTGETATGAEAIKENVNAIRTTYPDFFVQVENIIAKGETASIQWTASGTNTGPMNDMPPTGREVVFSGVSITTIVDGKIAEELVYFDNASVLEQLGFTFVPPEIED